jgi:mannose-1-phosphate guanylyltransferase
LSHHLRHGAKATLLVHRTADPRAFGGGVAVERGRIVAFRRGAMAWEAAAAKRVFAGAAVLDPALIARLPTGFSDVVSALYEPMIEAGDAIAACETARPWFDVGTPARYLDAALAWALRALPERGAWIAPGASVDPLARLRRVAVESGATIGAGARLEETLVLPGAAVGANARLEHAIVGPGVVVADGSRVANALLTRGADGAPAETPL